LSSPSNICHVDYYCSWSKIEAAIVALYEIGMTLTIHSLKLDYEGFKMSYSADPHDKYSLITVYQSIICIPLDTFKFGLKTMKTIR
jgi:hypothetical protein